MIAEFLIAATRFLVGGHAHWQGCAPTRHQRIYFANHSSHLDTILLWAALPRILRRTAHPVAAADYWGTNAFKRYIAVNILNAVLVDRAASRDPLGPLRAALDRGHSLIIFPEGGRTGGILPAPFKPGLFHLARSYPAVELVPVFLTNLARAYPKGAILPAPVSCVVRLGTPISLRPDESKSDFLAGAHKAVCAMAQGDLP